MIAKTSTISHGANAIRYSVNKEKADIVKANFLPDDISPEAMYGRMMLVQKKFAENINKGRPLGRNVIRIEISPSEEESRDWTMDDWERLSNEFIRVFDSIDLSGKTKRASSKQTNLKGSQYIVALHRDSKSGILHLHIDANRVDMDGKINDSHKIGERAVMAANIINERRGWMQSEEIGIRHRQEISVCCMEILRKMDKFSWKQYEAELTKRGYKVHLQEKEICSILVVGLGNRQVTPDALGPYVVDNLRVTRHIMKEYGRYAMEMEENGIVSAIVPGVMGQTGMETLEIIKGIVSETKPIKSNDSDCRYGNPSGFRSRKS